MNIISECALYSAHSGIIFILSKGPMAIACSRNVHITSLLSQYVHVSYWTSTGLTVSVHYKSDGCRLLWTSNASLKTNESTALYFYNITLSFKEQQFQTLSVKMLNLKAVFFFKKKRHFGVEEMSRNTTFI